MFDVFRKIYLKSFLYDKKISNNFNTTLKYKPSTDLIFSILKLRSKKLNIDDFTLESVWTNNELKDEQIDKLNNFFWLFSLDLKSSNTTVQSVIKNWFEINSKYDSKSWNFITTSKRITSWLSNSRLTYDESSDEYKKKFGSIIQKQALHLVYQLDKIKNYNEKLIGIAAIILVGLSFNDEKNFVLKGLDQLKKIIKISLTNYGFPKSRSIKQSIFFLKYLILIREWFKESQSEIPELLNENIYYLGQSYAFFWKNINIDPLFNGNNISNNKDFDQYLKRLGYTFKNQNYEFSGYASLSNQKINLIMDIGPSPTKKFSNNYQAGALSFEFSSNENKIFTNCGIYQNENSKLNKLSRSSALHNTLTIDDNSSCKFNFINRNYEVNNGLNITKKNIIYEKNYWKINSAHDGFLKKFNLIFERQIEYYPEKFKLIGSDIIIGKKHLPNLKFDVRFHLDPQAKIMKTQDNKSIFIEIGGEGWKFSCDNYEINIDNGLYFGKKNTHTENQNIFISGIINSQTNYIKWELNKI
tara:strand:+ start:706 stop:2286 length:1581 start_codon:yes stop_codon:yes gene_type:complete